jgi:hypothetical protein
LVKNSLAKKPRCDAVKSLAEVLIALHGSWLDKRGDDQIVDKIKKARKKSRDLAEGFWPECVFERIEGLRLTKWAQESR